jgi:hypothetical protein
MGNPRSLSGLSRCFLLFAAWLVVCCGHADALAPAEAPTSGAEPREAAGYGYSAEEAALDSEGGDLRQMSVTASNKSTSTRAGRSAAPPPPPRAPGPDVPASNLAKASPAAGPAPEPGAPAVATSEVRSPLLVYSATVTMAVFGLDAALDAVEAVAQARDGYLVRRTDASIVIRVPAAAFQDALSGVGKLGDELHRDVSAEDVTEAYHDLQMRLRNAEVVRQRLEALLAKAANVDDALAVERELSRVTEEIERFKGKLKLYGELVQFSTITVNFQARGVEHVNPQTHLPFRWLQELGLSNLLSL